MGRMTVTYKTTLVSTVATCTVLVGALGAPVVRAQTVSPPVTITEIGCNIAPTGTTDVSCFVYISQTVGPSGCSQNSLRWDPNATVNGQAALAQLTAAFEGGQQVTFAVSNTCWSEDAAFPTFQWYNVLAP